MGKYEHSADDFKNIRVTSELKFILVRDTEDNLHYYNVTSITGSSAYRTINFEIPASAADTLQCNFEGGTANRNGIFGLYLGDGKTRATNDNIITKIREQLNGKTGNVEVTLTFQWYYKRNDYVVNGSYSTIPTPSSVTCDFSGARFSLAWDDILNAELSPTNLVADGNEKLQITIKNPYSTTRYCRIKYGDNSQSGIITVNGSYTQEHSFSPTLLPESESITVNVEVVTYEDSEGRNSLGSNTYSLILTAPEGNPQFEKNPSIGINFIPVVNGYFNDKPYTNYNYMELTLPVCNPSIGASKIRDVIELSYKEGSTVKTLITNSAKFIVTHPFEDLSYYIVDSRGRMSEKISAKITPSINIANTPKFVVADINRNNSASQNAYYTSKVEYSDDVNNNNRPSTKLSLYYREQNSESWSGPITLRRPVISGDNINQVTIVNEGGTKVVFDNNKAYEAFLRFSDCYYTIDSASFVIPKGMCALHITNDGYGVGIGTFVNPDKQNPEASADNPLFKCAYEPAFNISNPTDEDAKQQTYIKFRIVNSADINVPKTLDGYITFVVGE